MRKRVLVLFYVGLFSLSALTQEMKLPVFFLRYEGALGTEESEDEDIEYASDRHTISLRIKEEFSSPLTVNLLSSFSRKRYLLRAGSYLYFLVNPYMTLDITDRVRWYNGIRSKWVVYDERDTTGAIKDYTDLLFDEKLIFKPIDDLKLTPSVKGAYDLHVNQEKTKQTYTIGFAIDAQIDNIDLGGKYRAITRFPLGALSEITTRFNHEFGGSLSWDPNG